MSKEINLPTRSTLKTIPKTSLIDCIYKIVERHNRLVKNKNKAIEYIENEGEHTDCSGEPIYYLDEEQEEELLKILKGEPNNE